MRVALIGHGYWGEKLAWKISPKNCAKIIDFTLTQICDLSLKQLENAASNTKYDNTVSFNQQIDFSGCDVVFVATPIPNQYEIIKNCLQHKKHVLATKTLATSEKEARELYSLALKNSCSLFVDYTFLYSSGIQVLKNEIQMSDEGFKRIFMKRLNVGKFLNDMPCVWDLACHDLSILFYLFEDIDPDQCRVHFFGDDHDSTLFIQNQNRRIQIHTSWDYPYKTRELTLIGQYSNYRYLDVYPNEKLSKTTKGFSQLSDNEVEYSQIIDTDINFIANEPIEEMIKSFSLAIKNESSLPQANIPLNVIKVLESIYPIP
jgi:predicted dehydrogenase